MEVLWGFVVAFVFVFVVLLIVVVVVVGFAGFALATLLLLDSPFSVDSENVKMVLIKSI